MTASYPSTVKSFTPKVDFTDTVLALHVNDLQDEVNAIQTTLGTSIRTSSGWVGSFDTTTVTWNSVKDRIANIEYGLKTVSDNYVSSAGGSTITSSAIGIVSLNIRARASQTANLVEFRNSSNTVVSNVDAAGEIYTSSRKLVPIVYSATLPTSVPAGTIWVDSTSNVATITPSVGIIDGGTTGQVLAKNSNTDYDIEWITLTVPDAGTLSGTTLNATIVNSSLTSVGTLGSLTVTGTTTSGLFSGPGTSLTNLEATDFGILSLMGAWV